MSQFRTQRRRGFYGTPGFAVAVVLGTTGCLASSGPSCATEIFLISDALTDPGMVAAKGQGVDARVYASPLALETADASGSGSWMGDLVDFFMDILDFITASWRGQQSSFQEAGGGGGGLSRTQTRQIGAQVNSGAQIVHFHAITPPTSGGGSIAGGQGAIRPIENPADSAPVGMDTIQSELTQDLGLAGSITDALQTIPLDGDPNPIHAAASIVPEPSTWVLMMLGALGIGVRLRRAMGRRERRL